MKKKSNSLTIWIKEYLARLSILIVFIFGLSAISYSQNSDAVIKGIVHNEKGKSMEGVSVEISSINPVFHHGVVTDTTGSFTFTGLKPGSSYTLSMHFVGYQIQKKENIKAGEQPIDLLITLQPEEATDLNEIVVVGYGTEKKINVTGAIDQISGKELAKRPIANVFQGLQGVSPGLNITYKGGQPGSTPAINVRGFASINDNNGSPLILIDGIAAVNDDLLRINPADIASITVLRDAASAAIYGARAAFGVIMVTTKSGASGGRQSISYRNYFALSKPTTLPQPVTDPFIYAKVLETSTDNTPWDYVNFTPWQYDWARQRSDDPTVPEVKENPDDPTQWAYMGSNNWNDYFFNKSSFSQNHSISFSGSSANQEHPFSYILSADYTDENGLNKLSKDDWNRYGLRSRLSYSPISWLKLDNNLNVYQLKRDAPTYSITDIYYLQPIQVAKNPDGSWANTGAGKLSAQLIDGGRNQQTRFGFQNIFRGVATFLNGDLQFTGDASLKRELWRYHTEHLPYNIGYGPGDIRQEGTPSSITETNGTIVQNVYDLFANYTHNWGDHAIKLLAGFNQEYYEWSPVSVSRNDILSSSVPFIGLATGDIDVNTKSNGGYYAYATRSLFGRINYTYKDRYILEINGRRDGSSRFPSDNRWGFFPSYSGAWLVSNEPFMRSLKPMLSNFKLRASYGKLGNQSVAYYGYIQSLAVSTSGYLIDNMFPTVMGTAPSLSVDPNHYTWEKVNTTNFGTDFGLFDNKVSGTFDYYIRNTTGMLAPSSELPAVLGTSAPQQNSADLTTRGWELSLSYRNSFQLASKPLSFGAKFILSNSKSKITNYRNALGTFSAAYRPGEEIGELWGLTNDGMFKDEDEIAALDESELIPWGALSIVPGWPKYKDLDGNGKIEQGSTESDPKDLKIIGNTSPRYRFALNLDFNWNNIDLSVFVQGIAKQDFYPHHYLFWGPYQQPYANIYPWNLDFYRPTAATPEQIATYSKAYIAAGLAKANTDSYFPVLQSWLADNNYGAGLDIPQTKYLLNAAYLRVKNLTLGYTLPLKWTEKYGVKRFRIFFTGENLFEFSEVKKYFDPEAITDGYGWEYPYQRKYSIGINVDL